MKYDAIIVGASFAGLAVATRLRRNVFVIDKEEAGTGAGRSRQTDRGHIAVIHRKGGGNQNR